MPQDEHDGLRSELQTGLMDEIRQSIRFVHLSADSSASSAPLPDKQLTSLLLFDTTAHYYNLTDDIAAKPTASSIFAIISPPLEDKRMKMLRPACEALSLVSELESYLHSITTRWFSSVIAFVSSEGWQRKYLSYLREEQYGLVAAVQLEDPKQPKLSVVRGGPALFASADQALLLLARMIIICDGVWAVAGEPYALQVMVFETVIRLVLQQVLPLTIPGSVTDLLAYGIVTGQVQILSNVVQLTDSIEKRTLASTPLMQWCADIHRHFLRSVRLLALDRCRELLINNDYQVHHAEQTNTLPSALATYPSLFFSTSVTPDLLAANKPSNELSLVPTPESVPTPMVQLLPARLQARVLSSYLASHSPISLQRLPLLLHTVRSPRTMLTCLHCLARPLFVTL